MGLINYWSATLLLAVWVMVIAIVAVQNATAVSLRFGPWQTIQIPFGLLLAMAAVLGMLAGMVGLSLMKLRR